MASIFDAYNQEFNNLSAEIQRNINDLKALPTDSEKIDGTTRHIEGLIGQANELIKQMNVEVRSQDPGTKKVLTEKVAAYMKSLSSNKSDFERAREQVNRSSLIGDRSAADRQRLLDTNAKLDRQNEMILNATRTVAETNEVGIEINNELARNREKIESSRSRTREFAGLTDSARRVLNSMGNRDTRQKYIIAFVAVVLIIAISVTAYYSTSGKKN